MIQPQNILLTTFDEYPTYKLADFGMARIVSDNVLTTACGTPNYYSPEIINGDIYSFAVDFWSLGVLMYHLLCGYVPFRADNIMDEKELFNRIRDQPVIFPQNPWAKISEQAKDLIVNLLKKNPG